MKTKAPISFTIKRSPRTKQFRCVVRNEGNHEIILTGESCKNRLDVIKMIQSLIDAIKAERFLVVGETEVAAPAKPKCCGKGCKKPKHYEGKISRQWP